MADIGESIAMRIIENCPDVDPSWLLTGKGEMLKSDASPPSNDAKTPGEKRSVPAPKSDPTMSLYAMILERDERLARENALIGAENERLKTENEQLKAENDDLKKRDPRHCGDNFDTAPTLMSVAKPEVKI